MVTLTEKIALLEFGAGDILVGNGTIGGIPTLTFSNTEKKEVGSTFNDGTNTVRDLDNPVVLTFTNEKSIDVIIKGLEKVRAIMHNQKLEEDVKG